MRDGPSESQEEILAASEAALTDEDIPPEDEAFGWPDPDCGMPTELIALSDADLAELLDATPAEPAPAPAAWPLTCQGSGFGPANGVNTGTGFAQYGVLDELPASMVLAGFADDAHARVATLDDDSVVGVLRAWRRLASWASARELAMVAELARRRPADGTPPAAGPGEFPPQISEFAADEVGLALTLTGRASRAELDLALDLTDRPAIFAALEAGAIDLPKVQIMTSMICPLDRAHADAVEVKVLPRAPDLTTGELRAALQRAILAVDPDAARRRQEAAQRDARVEYWVDPEGTATLAGRFLPPAEVLAADKRLCAIATGWRKQGAQGGMDLLRAHAYLALLLGRPVDTPPPSLLPADQPKTPSPSGSGSTGVPGESGGVPGRPGSFGGVGQSGEAPGKASPFGVPAESGGVLGGSGSRGVPAESGEAPGGQGGAVPGGLRQPPVSVQLPPMMGEVNLMVPLSTLLGLVDRPGEAAGFGPLHADTARRLADAMTANRGTRWGVIVTSPDGRAMGYGSARARPVSAGGWKITLTTEPIAPYP